MFKQSVRVDDVTEKKYITHAKLRLAHPLPSGNREHNCLLTVSVGQPVHTDEKLMATVKAIAESNRFKKVFINLADTLQRHTIGLTSSEPADKWLEQAESEGDKWLSDNCKILDQGLGDIPYEVIRWDRWRFNPSFAEAEASIEELYKTDPEYKAAFQDTISEFLSRYQKRLESEGKPFTEVERSAASLNSYKYLAEECAVMLIWANEHTFPCEVYPSKRNAAMEATHKKLVLPLFPEVLHPIQIKFKSKRINNDQ